MVTKEIQKIHSYAILMALYESGYDYLGCYVPIVMQFVPDYDFTDVSIIKHDLESFIDLPEFMVSKILHTAREKGFVDFDEKHERYRLRRDAQDKIIEQRKTVTKRIRQLTNEINRYCINNGVFPDMTVSEMVEAIIVASGFNLDFIRPGYVPDPFTVGIEKSALKMLVQFLKDSSTQTAYLKTFKEFVMGSIISKALEWTDLDTLSITKIRKWQLFLDTNFVFSLLEMHEERINKPVKEMYKKLMARFGFNLNIFDFTLQQMRGVILAYSPEETIVVPNIQRPDVHNTFKRQGWSKEKVKKYADNLPKLLQKMGITIHKTDIRLHYRRPPDDKDLADLIGLYKELFLQYKSESENFGLQHDLAAIMMIQKIRGRPVTNFHNAKAFFLTSDRKLTDFCQLEMGARSQRTVSEVVLDMSFGTMLWCLQKDYKVQFSIDMIIAAFSRTLFISKKIWERFMLVLAQVTRKNNISIEEIPNIFYKKIQNILNEFSEADVDKITEPFIIDKIMEARENTEAFTIKIRNMKNTIAQQKQRLSEMAGEMVEKQQRYQAAKIETSEYAEKNNHLVRFIWILGIAVSAISIIFVLSHVI